MITEDYVSFETAKLLKEKGFDVYVRSFYDADDMPAQHTEALWDWNLNKENYRFSAPTLQMAMKWLREVKHIPIEILWHYDVDSDVEEWYFIHHAELRILPNDIEYYETYEKACEAGI